MIYLVQVCVCNCIKLTFLLFRTNMKLRMKKCLITTLTISILFITIGCAGEPSPVSNQELLPTPTPESAPSHEPNGGSNSIAPTSGTPLLSDALIRDCQRTGSPGDFGAVGLAIGETAIDFTLMDIHGNTVNLAGLLSEKPVVMVFGSFT